MAKEITDTEYQKEVIESNIPVVVDFWAPWCGPCKMLSPILEKVTADYDGKIKVVKVNVDDNQQYASQLGVSGIPTLAFYKNGNVAEISVGLISENELKDIIDKVV